MKKSIETIPQATPELEDHWRSGCFLHGTTEWRAESILEEGFQLQYDEDGDLSYINGNCMGAGAYLTLDPRIAFFFGNVILRVELQPGTRILDIAPAADRKILNRLRKEFGKEILEVTNPAKAMPRNKQLTLPELVAWLSHHFHKTFPCSQYGDSQKQLLIWRRHYRALLTGRRLVQRYGYHGYGNPWSDIGMLVFASDRVHLAEVVAVIPPENQTKEEWYKVGGKSCLQSVENLRAWYSEHGTEGADLVERVKRKRRGV